ncbi:MAG: SPOR domain-containing protein [Cyclobacteriaceae bacterium]
MEGKEFYQDDDQDQNDSSKKKDEDSDDFGLPEMDDDTTSDEDDAPNTKRDDFYEPENISSTYDPEPSPEEERQWTSYGNEDTYNEEEVVYEEEKEYRGVHGLDDDDSGSKTTTIVVIISIVILVLAIGGGLFWWFNRDTKPVVQEPVRPVVETPVEPQIREEPVVEPTPEPVVGYSTEQIELIENPTGNYYVIIGSFFDSDLARDYGKKLAKDNIGSVLLAPRGKNKFYRLAIADFASLQDATVRAESLKSTYGEEVWVIRF